MVEAGPSGDLTFRRPDGRLLPYAPPLPTVPPAPVAALRAWACGEGLRLHSRTGCASGPGEPLDLVWALDVLHPLAQVAAGAVEP